MPTQFYVRMQETTSFPSTTSLPTDYENVPRPLWWKLDRDHIHGSATIWCLTEVSVFGKAALYWRIDPEWYDYHFKCYIFMADLLNTLIESGLTWTPRGVVDDKSTLF